VALVEITDLHVSYGAIRALQGISFSINQGEIVTLIGANGAGKSTTLRTISGLLRPIHGDIFYKGNSIIRTPAEKIVKLGISQVPEGRQIFSKLTVRENLEMGAYTRRDKREVEGSMERVFASFPRLKERLKQLGGTLSGGEQQMLAIGLGLMSRPKLLLLDEPSTGLAPKVLHELMKTIVAVKEKMNTSILIVEQNVNEVLKVADEAYVMKLGRIVCYEQCAETLLYDDKLRKAYLS